MRVSIWDKPDRWITECGVQSFEDANILEAKRLFYLFFDKENIDNYKMRCEQRTETIHGKAIQINLSLIKGGNDNIDLVPWCRGSNNSTYMLITMYIYDTAFYGTITDFKGARFYLTEALTSGTINDYDIKKAMLSGTNIYSRDLRDKPEKIIRLQQTTLSSAPSIPEPKYYTMRQQEVIEDDMYCITSMGTSIEHEGWELLDDNTSISVMDVLEMDTLEPIMKDKLYQVRNSLRQNDFRIKMFDSTELSDYTLYQDFISMQNGYTYIYDTNMGCNIIATKKAFIPFVKHQFKDKLQYDIEKTLKTIKDYAKGVENELGSVRLTFTPLYYGDKVDAYFKDWNPDNQPTLKKQIGVDNGYKLKNDIADRSYELTEDDIESLSPPEGALFM